MKVKDAMHKGVDWVSPDTPITEIAKLMRAHDIGCIPIGEDDKLVGMVTDRDIVCKGLAGNGFDASRAKARDVMTEGIHCCREDDDLAKAIDELNGVLGPDLDAKVVSDADKSKRDIALGLAGTTVANMIVPMRGVVREVSGAAGAERKYREAIYAGSVRRGYLKGLGEVRGCKPPAAPAIQGK